MQSAEILPEQRINMVNFIARGAVPIKLNNFGPLCNSEREIPRTLAP
jgi:hypothetical protein